MTDKKYSLISIMIAIPVIFTIIVFTNMSENDIVVSEQDDVVIKYVPSDLTKAVPNLVVEHAEKFWVTTDIKKVKDDVIYTIQGTVLSIDEPIDWISSDTYSPLLGHKPTLGFIPITISVENVYKGKLLDETFTFYVTSHKHGDSYILSQDDPHFELDETILINLAHSDLGSFQNGHYYPKLSHFGTYQLQKVPSDLIPNFSSNKINSDGTVTLAFNAHHPNGIPLDLVSGEAVP